MVFLLRFITRRREVLSETGTVDGATFLAGKERVMPEPFILNGESMGKQVEGAVRCHPKALAEIIVLKRGDSRVNLALCPICGGFNTYTGG